MSGLALELLGLARLPSDPLLFAETLRAAAERFLARVPGVTVAVWRTGTPPELVCRSGPLAGLSPEELRVPEADWAAVASAPRGLEWSGNVELLAPAAASQGASAARLLRWGQGPIHGVLLALDSDPDGRGLEASAADLELLAAYFGSTAALAAALWDVQKTKKRLEGDLSTLHQVASTIARQAGGSDSLGAVVSIVAKAMNADLCAFLLFDEAKRELVVQPGGYGLSGDEGSLYRISLDEEHASSVRVFRTGTPFVTGDAMSDPQVLQQYAKLWKVHSLIVVPLTMEGRRVGVMRVGSFERNFYSAADVEFVQLIAEEAVVLLESAMLTRKLAETNHRLAEVNRIKDEFVSTVSHEFKTPLTSIKGFTTVLLEESTGALTTEQKRFLTIIANACERLNALVSDLLDLARLEGDLRMEFAPVSIADLLRQARETHQWQADSRTIEFRLSAADGLPSVRGDARWLRQVLDNLVSNALKFTPHGGQVEVTARRRGDAVEITVSDTGVGIAAEDQPNIFQKFYRARSAATANVPGTGLGLAIARSVAEKHEGKLWFESKAGEGSKFHLLLPVARGEASSRVEAQAAALQD